MCQLENKKKIKKKSQNVKNVSYADADGHVRVPMTHARWSWIGVSGDEGNPLRLTLMKWAFYGHVFGARELCNCWLTLNGMSNGVSILFPRYSDKSV